MLLVNIRCYSLSKCLAMSGLIFRGIQEVGRRSALLGREASPWTVVVQRGSLQPPPSPGHSSLHRVISPHNERWQWTVELVSVNNTQSRLVGPSARSQHTHSHTVTHTPRLKGPAVGTLSTSVLSLPLQLNRGQIEQADGLNLTCLAVWPVFTVEYFFLQLHGASYDTHVSS